MTNDKKEGGDQLVPTVLSTKATAELDAQVKSELNIPDPGPEAAKATLQKDEDGEDEDEESSSFALIDRDELHELGRRGPYYRFVQFPVEITEELTFLEDKRDTDEASK